MEASTATPAPGPGWYLDPNDSATNRYWDGARWTENRSPVGPVATPDGKEQHASGTIVAGYIFAVLMPLVGFIIGLTQINRSRHGLWVVVASVAAFVLWVALISASVESSTTVYTY
jgi:Protein of unknown function (DUF2510)